MELKDLEEMFKMEQELDIPYRDRWYNKDFDKRELEAIQEVNKCNLPPVSKTVCVYCGKPLPIVDAHIDCLLAEKERLIKKQTDR